MKNILTCLIIWPILVIAADGTNRQTMDTIAQQIRQIVNGEIENGSFPGAAVYVGKGDKELFFEAFGQAVSTPYKRAMKTSTVFDIASLSKPVATATATLILFDRGLLSPEDCAAAYIPQFAQNGKEQVMIKHLLSHTSGLPSYTSVKEAGIGAGEEAAEKMFAAICALKLQNPPGQVCDYSCLGYITLGKIVEAVSGQPLNIFVRNNIFKPLEMTSSCYNPPFYRRGNIAATSIINGKPNRGTVHDPIAAAMGGVSGNAGVFSTAEDLANFCRMTLNQGTFKGRRILSPQSAAMLTTDITHGRAYGFDVNSKSHSWIKGDCFGDKAYCHSGYTGTSIVCDPQSGLFVIILTNRVHPADKGSTKTVRKEIADIVCRLCGDSAQ